MSVTEQTSQIIDVLFAKFGIVIDWTNESVVPYLTTLCGKLITYEIWTSAAWMILNVIPLIIWLVIVMRYREAIKDDGDMLVGVAVFGSAFTILLAGGSIMLQTMDIIKCVTFPELYIIEYIQEAISK